MPASYVHQCAAAEACDALSLFSSPTLRSAVLAGSEGPDPFFFSVVPTPGAPLAPKLGLAVHTQRTDDFMLALADACAGSELTRAYCCGFFTHYGTDTTMHPFIYAHAMTPDGGYSSTLHCTLEHQLETLFFRRQGNTAGLPVQMAGFAQLGGEEKDAIAQALNAAVDKVFPKASIGAFRVRRSFDDAVQLCRLLRSESGKKFRTLGAVLRPFHLDAPLHAHMMPVNPPETDIANESHTPWASIWKPEQMRQESFFDLFAAAVQRNQTLIAAVSDYMAGRTSAESLRALHGGLCYDSGLPWQSACPAKKAPSVQK